MKIEYQVQQITMGLVYIYALFMYNYAIGSIAMYCRERHKSLARKYLQYARDVKTKKHKLEYLSMAHDFLDMVRNPIDYSCSDHSIAAYKKRHPEYEFLYRRLGV